jgi:hypothetical protein
MGLNGMFLLIYVLLAGWGARVGTIAALLLWFVFPWRVFFLKIESLPLSMDIFIFSLAGTLFSWISKMNPKKTRPIEAGIF